VRDAQSPVGVRRLPSPISVRAVHRCLDEVKQFAEWAVSHKYAGLAAY
jgi:hypothetical protein